MKIEKTITKWYITGDCHGQFGRFKTFIENVPNDETVGVIILGDVGFNYSLNQNDYFRKQGFVKKYKFNVYCLKGNHEARPDTLESTHMLYDDNVNGYVLIEDIFPTIRYFPISGEYDIDGHKTLVIGGAYSVDKHYRLAMNYTWFPDEQTTQKEMEVISAITKDQSYDIIMTHTCPFSYMPTDLFLNSIDQSTVDKTMEVWLDSIKDNCNWGQWFFGHYHADRAERPYVEQFFEEIEALDTVMARWDNYQKTGELDWWFPKARDFYMGR